MSRLLLDDIDLRAETFVVTHSKRGGSQWQSVMLADDFVWSDMASVSRPYGFMTQYEEDVHRGYGAAAYRQTRELLRVAMDQLSGLIQSRKPGCALLRDD